MIRDPTQARFLMPILSLLALPGCRAPGDRDAPAQAPPADLFVDATSAAGLDFVHFNGMSGELYFVEIWGPGGALLDYDNDGDLDLLLRQGSLLGPRRPAPEPPPTDRLYRNDLLSLEDGKLVARLVDVTAAAGLGFSDYGLGAATGDYDDDGFTDVYLTAFGANRLLHNRGDGSFADVTAEGGAVDPSWSAAATFFDFDRDGRLDLFVGNYVDFSFANHQRCFRPSSAPDYCGPMSYRPQPDALWRNTGKGAFEEVTITAGLAGAVGNALGVVTIDVDSDGWLDLAVANDAMENHLWLNRGDGSFEEQGLLNGIAVNQSGLREASMGISAGDFDRDGDEDLFLTHLTTETHTLYVNQGAGVFLDRTLPAGLAAPSLAATGFGTSWLDYDNDGWLDLLAVNGAVKVIEELERAGDPFPLHQTNQLFRNLGDGTFREVSAEAGVAFEDSEVSRGALFGDLDNDGDTDVVVGNNNGPARLLRNAAGDGTSWLGLRAVGGEKGRDMLGARIEVGGAEGRGLLRVVRTDGSYLSASDPRVLVGLGPWDDARWARVEWPSGRRQLHHGLPSRHYVTLRESSQRADPR